MDASKHNTEAPPTLVLTRAQVGAVMTTRDYLAAAEEAFRAVATGRATAPPPMHIPAENGGFHAKGARLQTASGRDYVAVKVNGNFPANPRTNGLPTIQGAIALSDATNGSLLALMDSIEITLRRTAAATALAATCLARPSADTLAIIGCGDQAGAQLAALAAEFRLRRVVAWDIDANAASAFATASLAHMDFEVMRANTLREATATADIIVTCTTAREPILHSTDVRTGTFIAAVGADSPHKSEIAPGLMARSKVVVDVLEQCAVMGDLHHAIAAGAMTAHDVHAALGELVVGQRPGREDDEEITLFDSTGTAVQDVAAAARVYERALAERVGAIQSLNR
ncbi:MAG: ornithine cyclodeaminase family protein [Alphaproteobacteria bacterium]|nr:ornithine cyclodeaminase family protein [Alphaproteobacteria bacterium]